DDVVPGEVAEFVELSGLHRSTVADDGDGVAELLDLGEDVAGQKDGAAVISQFANQLGEGGLHQRIEPGRRLIEDVEIDIAGESEERRVGEEGRARSGPAYE